MKACPISRRPIAALLLVPLLLAWTRAPQSSPPPPPGSAQQNQAPPASASPEKVPVPLPPGTRLFLRDGSFQLVREYKIGGDRVRYWSTEREEWEEIPASLIDWEATHKGEAEDKARIQQIDRQLKEIARHERAASLDVDASLEVAPHVFLPDDPGFYVLANGAVRSVSTDLAESHRGKARLLAQIFTPIPVVPTKHSVELKGPRASFRIHDLQPEFFIRTADGQEPLITLVRVRVHGGSRLIAEINTDAAGSSRTKASQIALERWVAARSTFRYTLGQKLEPGEYAFVENVPEQGLDLYVWDFGVDPPSGDSQKK
ncbi:MAG TPA: hypothetical protein VLW54_09395 [Candidatus Acidoferrales bacterium]|nr:hypothetical protein [Candidatus Acidoferrales bacterium]